MANQLGLYIHIPFCSALCHYCDFAKTALYTSDHVTNYFRKAEADLLVWLGANEHPITSVFFGGGTPGLFTREYASLFDHIRPHLANEAEISLEANPHNITADNLAAWRGLGFNRLSIGIQTMDDQGLKVLTRDHSGSDAFAAMDLANKYFKNLNVDLIYGWPGQTAEIWRKDLEVVAAAGVTHLSLYCLTFEEQTTMGRKLRRGLVHAANDDTLAERYNYARRYLADVGFDHDEVSNWAKPGFSCRHNWLYWSDQPFIGIGAGAHGYLPQGDVGMRYSYSKDLKHFLRGDTHQIDPRAKDDWLLEYIGSSLRTIRGTDLELIARKTGLTLEPNGVIQRGVAEGMLSLGRSAQLVASEWFREVAWSLALYESLQTSKSELPEA